MKKNTDSVYLTKTQKQAIRQPLLTLRDDLTQLVQQEIQIIYERLTKSIADPASYRHNQLSPQHYEAILIVLKTAQNCFHTPITRVRFLADFLAYNYRRWKEEPFSLAKKSFKLAVQNNVTLCLELAIRFDPDSYEAYLKATVSKRLVETNEHLLSQRSIIDYLKMNFLQV